MDNQKSSANYIAATSAVLLWSASFIATKIAYVSFAPLQLGAIRTIITAVIFFVLRLVTGNREKIHRDDTFRVAWSGFIGITLYFTFENVGVSLTTSSNAALIVASFPAITTLLEFVIDRRRPTAAKIVGIALALVGVAIISKTTAVGSENQFAGNICLFSAGVLWAFYCFQTRKISLKYSAATLTYYQMLYGALLFVPVALLERQPWQMMTISSCGALLYLSVGCSLIAYLLHNYGLRELSASVAVSLLNLVPVFGVAFSALLLGEKIQAHQIAGGAIVIVGVLISTVRVDSKKTRDLPSAKLERERIER